MTNTEDIKLITQKIDKLRDVIDNHNLSIDSNFKFSFDDIISDDYDITDVEQAKKLLHARGINSSLLTSSTSNNNINDIDNDNDNDNDNSDTITESNNKNKRHRETTNEYSVITENDNDNDETYLLDTERTAQSSAQSSVQSYGNTSENHNNLFAKKYQLKKK